ncbi:MAG: hypothetical protein ACK2UK_17015 [Candidatus Promineifilaceae bacterium]
MSGKSRLLLIFWGALFLISVLILFFNLRSLRMASGAILPPFPGDLVDLEDETTIDKPGNGLINDGDMGWSLLLSTVSALVSAAGFMATTYFAFRTDRRETRLAELEIAKMATEIERQRLEIEELRRAQE